MSDVYELKSHRWHTFFNGEAGFFVRKILRDEMQYKSREDACHYGLKSKKLNGMFHNSE